MKIGLLKDNRGVTILWFVASVALILVAMTISLTSFYSGGRVISSARSTSAASSAASGELERMRALPFASIKSHSFSTPSELARMLPAGRGNVRVEAVDPSLKKVTVTVNWLQDKERERNVRLVTLVGEELAR